MIRKLNLQEGHVLVALLEHKGTSGYSYSKHLFSQGVQFLLNSKHKPRSQCGLRFDGCGKEKIPFLSLRFTNAQDHEMETLIPTEIVTDFERGEILVLKDDV